MRFFNLLRRHFLDDLFQADGGIRITTNCRECVPHQGPDQVRCRHSPAGFVIPANSRLRPRMPFERTAQIPFKRTHIVARDTQPHGVEHPDQLFRIGIAGARGGQQFFARSFKLPRFHQIARDFYVRRNTKARHHQTNDGKAAPELSCHLILPVLGLMCLTLPAGADMRADIALPAPLADDDFIKADPAQAQLGHLLFYDRILSGNRNISCATCHHPDFGSSDGLSLGIGEGGQGLGPDRTPGTGSDKILRRIPRNAPGLWNLGAREIRILMHDGRISAGPLFGDNGFHTPAEEWLPRGLNSVLAAQALFPVISEKEMLGQNEENEIAGRVKDRIDYGWPLIAKRVRTIPQYGALFVKAFDHINTADEVTIVEIANALAAFMTVEFRSTDSPFDAFLAGDRTALGKTQAQGMALFFGKAACSSCHGGSLLSDHGFHALSLPAFGPGRTRKFDLINRDVGRMGASDDLADAYRFRTPMLRNVALTGPYGHNGAYPTLERMIRHHLDPAASRARWKPKDLILPDIPWRAGADFIIQQDRFEMARQAATLDISLPALTDEEVSQLVAFLNALTGAGVHTLPFGVPENVPSGLPVDRRASRRALHTEHHGPVTP